MLLTGSILSSVVEDCSLCKMGSQKLGVSGDQKVLERSQVPFLAAVSRACVQKLLLIMNARLQQAKSNHTHTHKAGS
jgi:hypothetical protein